jgi:predicted oxidoreductase
MTLPTVSLRKHGPEVSRLVYGVWRLADEPHGGELRAVRERIDLCLELGMRTFDHADIYGGYRCEELFGRALREAPSLRDQIDLISKCDICLRIAGTTDYRVKHYDTSARHIAASVDRSLQRLATDRLDVLLLHRPDPLLAADEVAEVLRSLIAAGKVRYIGVSNFRPHQLSLLASRLEQPIVTNQIEVSVLCTEPLIDGSLDQCQQRRIRPMAWSPLAGGQLFGDSPRARRVRGVLERVGARVAAPVDTVALAWLLRHPAGIVPVIGSSRPERIRQAAAAATIDLDRQDWFEIYEAALGQEVP